MDSNVLAVLNAAKNVPENASDDSQEMRVLVSQMVLAVLALGESYVKQTASRWDDIIFSVVRSVLMGLADYWSPKV